MVGWNCPESVITIKLQVDNVFNMDETFILVYPGKDKVLLLKDPWFQLKMTKRESHWQSQLVFFLHNFSHHSSLILDHLEQIWWPLGATTQSQQLFSTNQIYDSIIFFNWKRQKKRHSRAYDRPTTVFHPLPGNLDSNSGFFNNCKWMLTNKVNLHFKFYQVA